jgi:stage III sporulation protein SpoIIIAA
MRIVRIMRPRITGVNGMLDTLLEMAYRNTVMIGPGPSGDG